MVGRSFALVVLAAWTGVVGAHPGYRIKEFPAVGGEQFHPSGLNDAGQFVGGAWVGTYSHAFIFSFETGFTEVPFTGIDSMVGKSINNNGAICGDTNWRSFKWSPGQGVTWLPAYNAGRYYWAEGISDSEDIYGWELDGDGYWYGSVTWDPSGNVTYRGSNTYINGINASGRLIGVDTISCFYQDPGQAPHYLPPIAGITGISDSGLMSGVRTVNSNYTETVLWSQDGQSVIPLGQAHAISKWSMINDRSEVVWSKYPSGSNVLQGQYWSPATGLRTIDSMIDPSSQSLQYSVMEVIDINNLGQMLVLAKKPWQQPWEGRRILLEPVPEPATLAALTLGTLALLRKRPMRTR